VSAKENKRLLLIRKQVRMLLLTWAPCWLSWAVAGRVTRAKLSSYSDSCLRRFLWQQQMITVT